MASPTRGPSCARRWASLEKILIWIGSGAFDRSLMLSCNTWVNSMSSSGSVDFISLAHFFHHFIYERLRLAFSFTVKSPVLASVTAARPICRPVRREVVSTSGMDWRMRSTCSRTRLVSLKELPAGMM